jgi:hypothetical protein
MLEERRIKRGREKPKKIIKDTIRKDLKVNEFDSNMVYHRALWRNLTYVADPT